MPPLSTRVALDDRCLAATPGAYQHPGVRGQGLPRAPRGREEEQVDGVAQRAPGLDLEQRPVREERRVEGSKRVRAGLCDRGEPALERAVTEPLTEARDTHSSLSSQGRQPGREAAVDEHQLVASLAAVQAEGRDRRPRQLGRPDARVAEDRTHDGRHARVLPLFVSGGGEPERLETLHRAPAQRAQPGRRGRARRLLEATEGRAIEIGFHRGGAHRAVACTGAGAFSSQA